MRCITLAKTLRQRHLRLSPCQVNIVLVVYSCMIMVLSLSRDMSRSITKLYDRTPMLHTTAFCSKNVSVLHRVRDTITTLAVCVTVCDLENHFRYDIWNYWSHMLQFVCNTWYLVGCRGRWFDVFTVYLLSDKSWLIHDCSDWWCCSVGAEYEERQPQQLTVILTCRWWICNITQKVFN